MQDHDHSVRRLRQKIAFVLSCKYAVGLATVWAFVWGTVVLVLCAELGASRLILLWGLAGLPVAVAIGVAVALRRLPALSTLRAMLDERSHCGGLLMADGEAEIGNWRQEMPDTSQTTVRWSGGRSWGLLAVAAVFVALAFWVPERFAGADTSNPLEVGDKVDRLAKQIQVLKEESVLEDERADALKKKLEQLRDEAKGKEPAKTLEALDHLRDMAKNAAKSASESSLQKTEELAKAETLAEGIRQALPNMDAKLVAEGMKALAEMMEKFGKENESFEKLAEAMKAAADGKLSPEQLAGLAELLRDCKGDIADHLARLHEVGLIDLETLKKCESCGKCQGEALAELLKKCEGGQSVCDMLGCCLAGYYPGQGGINEGGGPVPLTFGVESDPDGTKFTEQALPPADLSALKDSVVAGVGKAAPKPDKPGAPSESGALRGAKTGGGSANRQIILPQHKKTVEKFFDRPAEPKK